MKLKVPGWESTKLGQVLYHPMKPPQTQTGTRKHGTLGITNGTMAKKSKDPRCWVTPSTRTTQWDHGFHRGVALCSTFFLKKYFIYKRMFMNWHRTIISLKGMLASGLQASLQKGDVGGAVHHREGSSLCERPTVRESAAERGTRTANADPTPQKNTHGPYYYYYNNQSGVNIKWLGSRRIIKHQTLNKIINLNWKRNFND